MEVRLSSLAIDIPAGEDRRIGWADREAGWLELWSASVGRGEGYLRRSERRLRDLCLVEGGRPKDRRNARMLVLPGELEVRTRGGARLAFALLMGREAAWIRVEAAPRGKLPGLGLVLPRDLALSAPSGGVPGAKTAPASDAAAPAAPLAETGTGAANGFAVSAVLAGGPGRSACGIRSSLPFRLHAARRPGLVIGPDEALLVVEFARSAEGAEVYLAWAEDEAAAQARASALAEGDAIESHRAEIAAFVSDAAVESGKPAWDRALAWAAFSGWSLVTREAGTGIWAGLPWFREHWARDTFVALPGILLCTGRLEEAREVILDSARRQERDPASPDFGRIPNRWRSPDDAIYNTADGTLWFIRAVWDFAQRSGDASFLAEAGEAVFRALDADLERRSDSSGFLRHGNADTWMDARIEGGLPWTARGDRAVEIQALWYTALLAGSRIASIAGDRGRAGLYRSTASRLRQSFRKRFWRPEHDRLADRLLPDRPDGGPGGADLSSRPNAFLALSLCSLLDDEEPLLPAEAEARILADCSRELVFPHGVASLSPEDPRFHPDHEGSGLHHKDAAYHNGTVWAWNAGFAVSAMLRHGAVGPAWALCYELARQTLEDGAVGSLSENSHAMPGSDGGPRHSGAWSQAWSVAEFLRNAHEDWLGFRPRLMDGRLLLAPRLPPGVSRLAAEPRLGAGGRCAISIERRGVRLEIRVLYLPGPGAAGRPPLVLGLELAGNSSIARLRCQLRPDREISVAFDEETGRTEEGSGIPLEPRPPGPRSALGRELALASPHVPWWNRPSREKDWLRRVLEAGKGDEGRGSSLEMIFDAREFVELHTTSDALGAFCAAGSTLFRIWAPTAAEVLLALYDRGRGGEPTALLPLSRARGGAWELRVAGDHHGEYYAYHLRVHGLYRECVDPHAASAGENGLRGMIVDQGRCAPDGWDRFSPPSLRSPNDAVVMEVHVRDLSCHPSWPGPEALRGRFAGASLRGLSVEGSGAAPRPAGFDHLAALGVTHVQLLPVFDFSSVDESKVRESAYRGLRRGGAFNWGYDPQNWDAPEGSYSSDPSDGLARVRELKALVKAAGEAGVGVVMDVVYNHAPDSSRSSLELSVPGYFFRPNRDSGAGNDTASERIMMRRFMVASLCRWLRDYKLSGFRIDLMGLHDVETMRDIESALRRIKPDVLLYGEGWDMYGGAAMTPASQLNIGLLGRGRRARDRVRCVGMFNDALRDGIKGFVFDPLAPGFIHDGSRAEDLKFGLVGAVRHPGVANSLVTGSINPGPWTELTASSVNYAEIHDDLTLRDRNLLIMPGLGEEEYRGMQRLALGLVLLAQGLPVLHAGSEFLRTKEIPSAWIEEAARGGEPLPPELCWSEDGKRAFSRNSYDLSDEVNALDWSLAVREDDLVDWVAAVIAFRRAHPLFRLRRGGQVRRRLRFLAGADGSSASPRGLLAWTIRGGMRGESWREALVAVNALAAPAEIDLPSGIWRLVLDRHGIRGAGSASSATAPAAVSLDTGAGGRLTMPPRELIILARC